MLQALLKSTVLRLVLKIVSSSDLSYGILIISYYYLKRKLNSGLVQIALAYRAYVCLPP